MTLTWDEVSLVGCAGGVVRCLPLLTCLLIFAHLTDPLVLRESLNMCDILGSVKVNVVAPVAKLICPLILALLAFYVSVKLHPLIVMFLPS